MHVCVCVRKGTKLTHGQCQCHVMLQRRRLESQSQSEEIERMKQSIFIVSISQHKSDLVHGSWQLALQKGWRSYCSSHYVMLISSCLCFAL